MCNPSLPLTYFYLSTSSALQALCLCDLSSSSRVYIYTPIHLRCLHSDYSAKQSVSFKSALFLCGIHLVTVSVLASLIYLTILWQLLSNVSQHLISPLLSLQSSPVYSSRINQLQCRFVLLVTRLMTSYYATFSHLKLSLRTNTFTALVGFLSKSFN